jgi:hypothetical protein
VVKKITLSVFVFCLAWVAAANSNYFEPADNISVYQASPNPTKGNLSQPDMLIGGTYRYRVHGNTVTSQIGQFINKYEDCAVLNIENWKCTYSDKSGSFGIRDGEYWQTPPSSSGRVVISEIEYHLLICRWFLVKGYHYLPMCLIEPFFND